MVKLASNSRSHHLGRIALSIFEPESTLLDVARRASRATGCPVLGGVAVFLHGYRRTTIDVDLFTTDAPAAKTSLLEIGAAWSRSRREFELRGVPIHLVTTEQTEVPPASTSEIDGILVVSLADLMRMKLTSGLRSVARVRDLADAVELIRAVPLDKRFAARLPPSLRPDFKRLVDAVRAGDPRN